MRILATWSRTGTVLLGIVALLALGCAGRARPVHDDTPNLASLVDGDSARALLADLLARQAADLTTFAPRSAAPDVVQALGPSTDALRDQARLRELSQGVSLDFAALSSRA
jgi:hypothetical protein